MSESPELVRAQDLVRDGRVLLVQPVRARDREGGQRGEEIMVHSIQYLRV